MRQLDVYMNDSKVGTPTEKVVGKEYSFSYENCYLLSSLPPISVTLPKRKEEYKSDSLFQICFAMTGGIQPCFHILFMANSCSFGYFR